MDLRRQRGLISIALALPILAAAAVPVGAAQGLTITTAFPAVTVSPDSSVSFDLQVETTAPGTINLSVTGVPGSWAAELHGGGFVVDAVYTNGSDPTEVRLDVDVPADATGTTRITVVASDATSREVLPLDITVEAQAGGEITMDTDIPARQGASDDTFAFSLQIHNDTEQDLTYTATAQGPVGWTVKAEPTGQSQAVSATVNAGAQAGLTVTVTPPDDVPAGAYPIQVAATVGSEQLQQELTVNITGSYSMTFPANQVLSAHGPSGSVTEHTISVTNTGTAPVTGVKLTATSPTDWTVEFDKPTIDAIAPGDVIEVKARITPAGDAIAGDYNLTLRATGEEADADTDVRFTVETSILGAIIGGLLILGAVGGLLWVFRRYGRR